MKPPVWLKDYVGLATGGEAHHYLYPIFDVVSYTRLSPLIRVLSLVFLLRLNPDLMSKLQVIVDG